jgi:hypothetical protein
MVDLSIVPLRVANRAYGINRLDSRHLAAMSPGRDTCQGDSGGPLFDVDGASGAPLLVGVTSYGRGCALRDIPGIYANVGYFKSWLDLFLSQPVALDPDISVTGKGLDLPNGSTSVSVLNGTNYGRRLRGGRYASRTFIISNAAGTAPLSLLQIGSSLDSFDVIGAPRYVLGGSLVSFRVRWRAPYSSKRGKAIAEVSILSNDVADDEYTFTLMGKYRKSRAF